MGYYGVGCMILISLVIGVRIRVDIGLRVVSLWVGWWKVEEGYEEFGFRELVF